MLRERFAAVFATRTRDEWEQVFAGTDACVSPVLSLAEAPVHPHARGQERVRRGRRRRPARPGAAVRPDGGRQPAAPPRPGADTDAVLAGLGLSGQPTACGPAGEAAVRLLAASRLRSPQDAEILRLALPAFGALVAEPLFLLADSAIVGRLGTVPLGGLGVASQALTTLVGISIFLAYGTTAAVARQLGAGHRDAAIRQGIDGLWLAAIIGIVVLAAGWPLAPPIVHAFGGTAAVSQQAVIYLRISLLGAPGDARGAGGHRRPARPAGHPDAACRRGRRERGEHRAERHVRARPALGYRRIGLGHGHRPGRRVRGLPAVVGRGARRAGISVRPDRGRHPRAAAAGPSLVLRTLALQAVLVLMTAIAARQWDAAIAAHQVALRIWNLFVFALDAIAIAAQAITGR